MLEENVSNRRTALPVASDNSYHRCENSLSSSSFDKISEVLEKFGVFQVRAILMLAPTLFFVAMMGLSAVFLVAVPPFACKPPPVFGNQTDGRIENQTKNFNSTIEKNECFRVVSYKSTGAESIYNNTKGETEECLDGWDYNLTIGNTVTSEFNLVCRSSWKRPLVFSSYMAGACVGSIVGGSMADRYGRKATILISFIAFTFTNAALPFSSYYWIYICLLICQGFSATLFYFSTYVLALEFVHSGNKRNLAALVLNLSFNCGVLATPLIAYVAFNWKWIHWINASMSAVYIFLLWFVPKSPKWLLQTNSEEPLLKLLKNIAKTNRITIDEKSLTKEKLKLYYEETKVKTSQSLQEKTLSTATLWHNKTLRKRIVISCILWNFSFLGYYTFALNSSNIGGNIFINALVGGLADLASTIFMWTLLRKFGRRVSYCSIIGLCGLFALISQPILKLNVSFGIALVMIGRFFATTSMSLIVVYTGELFPTLLRSTSVGIASMTSRLGSILSPFLVLLGEEVNLSYSFYIIGTLCLFGALLACLLPETGNASLPNTLNEALELDKRKRFSLKGILKRDFFSKEETAEGENMHSTTEDVVNP